MHAPPVAAGKSSFDLIDQDSFFAQLPLSKQSYVLDLACGAGNYSLALARLLEPGGRIYAIDLWDEGLATLDRTAREQNLSQIVILKGDITQELPLAQGSVDLCLLATVLHDLAPPEQVAVLGEVARVLKDDGTLALVEFKKIDRGPGPPLGIRISPEEATTMLAGCGFLTISRDDIGEYTYLLLARKAA